MQDIRHSAHLEGTWEYFDDNNSHFIYYYNYSHRITSSIPIATVINGMECIKTPIWTKHYNRPTRQPPKNQFYFHAECEAEKIDSYYCTVSDMTLPGIKTTIFRTITRNRYLLLGGPAAVLTTFFDRFCTHCFWSSTVFAKTNKSLAVA